MSTAVSNRCPSSYEAGLEVSLREFLGAQLDRQVDLTGLRRLAGGTAHETWAFDLRDGERQELHRLVLRRSIERGMLDGDLRAEFDLLATLDRLAVPVPRPRWCVTEDSPLTQPFMIIDRVDGTDIRKHLATHPETDRHRLGVELVRLQARLHRLDWQDCLPPLARSARGTLHEIERWAREIDASSVDPGPLLRAATELLRDRPPKTSRRCLVHGDFKTNNLLLGADGNVTVLDWELAHLGDPLEDIAWTMLWTTRWDLVGGLLSVQEYLATYQEETGTAIDPEALLPWRIFALVKLAAIFLTGVTRGGPLASPTLRLMGRGLHHIEAQLAELLQATLGEAQPS
ncbi:MULTISPECIES: phosphotransferase family protein [Protofrankia]|uniref:Aminoglycoside phosphotransferase n=1 Tax=Candidatus Protofrankia datiscae TaxID=2716812 RepID=F8B432_9ACTN|nr:MULTISPECIES: phosphotransferase family protein [Protofrankia]AEH10053.1 aminoglycoside phosphotransferase [Candidatus Protofrankia datiscae]